MHIYTTKYCNVTRNVEHTRKWTIHTNLSLCDSRYSCWSERTRQHVPWTIITRLYFVINDFTPTVGRKKSSELFTMIANRNGKIGTVYLLSDTAARNSPIYSLLEARFIYNWLHDLANLSARKLTESHFLRSSINVNYRWAITSTT